MREQADHFVMIVFLIIPGALIYVAGRAVRFVLIGT
jgi:hypothetical protein